MDLTARPGVRRADLAIAGHPPMVESFVPVDPG